MDKESLSFLENLLLACGPSGFEEEVQRVWLKRTKKYADQTYKDVHGNAIAVLNPKASLRVMLAGHCDEIGFMITHITEQGFLYFTPIGGIDAGVLPGSQVTIQTSKGRVDGVMGKKAIHMMSEEERKEIVGMDKLYMDIGAKNKKDALKYVRVGDVATIAPNFKVLQNNTFTSKACDNRTGAFVVSEVLKILHPLQKKLNVGVYSVSTVQEEVGLRGAVTSAYTIDPQAAIAVDVGHATDTPNVDKKVNGETFLGSGPILNKGPVINPVLGQLIEVTAKKKKMAYQMRGLGRPQGTDTAVIQLSKAGVATALISVPNRYMHTSVEMCSFKDIQNIARLIAQTLLAMPAEMSFIPE